MQQRLTQDLFFSCLLLFLLFGRCLHFFFNRFRRCLLFLLLWGHRRFRLFLRFLFLLFFFSGAASSAASPPTAFLAFFFLRFFTSFIASCITSRFLRGFVPSVRKFKRSSTWSFSFSPNTVVASSEKQSMRDAMEHLLARYLEIRPLFFCCARPINVEWKIKPYFGVFPFVLSARNRAFSAPKIWTVDA